MKTAAAIAVLVLVFGAASQAQAPPPLRIVVIEGEDAVNVIQQKTAAINDQAGVVTGNATMDGTKAAVGPTTCGGQPVNGVFFSGAESDLPITGSPGAVTFRRERSGITDNNIAVTETVSFSGAISGNTITGTLTVSRRETSATRIGTGTGNQQVTLTRP